MAQVTLVPVDDNQASMAGKQVTLVPVDDASSATQGQPATAPWKQAISKYAHAILPGAGMAVGTLGGGVAGLPEGGVGAIPGGIVGGALGNAAGEAGARALDSALGMGKPQTLPKALGQTVKDIGEGAAIAGSGEVAGPLLKAIGKPVAAGAKQLLGATTGAGPGMVDEALKGGEAFKDAMRGKISGQEVVDHAKDALQSLKDQRGAAYQDELKKVSANMTEIDTKPVSDKLHSLLDRFKVGTTVDKKGKLIIDTSRSAMGKAGRKDIEDVVKTLSQWGTKAGDNTAIGLDTLKRQLDDFYSDSSQARSFVASIRNEVKDTITKAVPEYQKMTKGYAEASNLIKDIESNLMLRKEGMSGRITADQTLRRLTSAMRENFEMRKDLVEALGNKSGEDVSGQIAGYSASQVMPRGFMGKLAGGSAGYLTYLHPKLWPVLAASSPRVVGEFLTMFGKGLKVAGKIPAGTGAAAIKSALMAGKPVDNP